MAFDRKDQLNENMKRELSEIFQRELEHKPSFLVSVSKVQIASDYHSARVYISAYGSDEEAKRFAKQLNRQRGWWQHRLCERVVMKYMPKLIFIIDESWKKMHQMDSLLDNLEKE